MSQQKYTFEIELYDLPKPVELGIRLGFLKPGYTLKDYLIEAATHEEGYETVVLWGVQGTGKSSRMLYMLYWIYEEVFGVWLDEDQKDLARKDETIKPLNENDVWRMVLDAILFRPNTFVDTLEGIPDYETMLAVGWDDIGVHYPSTKFKTDIQEYEAIDSTWAAIRTKVHVIFVTLPLIDRLAKNVKDNCTFEVFIGKNRVEMVMRWFRLPGKGPDSNFFKARFERPGKIDVYKVPLWVWKEYWKKRIELTREALAKLKLVTKEELDGYIPVLEAAEIAYSQNLKYGTGTIQQDCSRGIMRSTRVGDYLLVNEDDFYRNILTKGGVDYREKPKGEDV